MKFLKKTTYALLGVALTGLAVSQLNAQSMSKPMSEGAKGAEHVIQGMATATFAGGCFWCTESGFEKLPGVLDAVSGYTGGKEHNPTYKQVSAGKTSHTEAVQVHYDPSVITYEDLLEGFWRQFDPTDGDGSFVDRGQQYRPGIFYNNDAEKMAAEAAIVALGESGRYDKPIVVPVTKLGAFYDAEDYHQDYHKRNPVRYKYYRFGSGRDQYIKEKWGNSKK